MAYNESQAFEIKKIIDHAPEFGGYDRFKKQTGLTHKEIRSFVKKQKRQKGFSISAQTGSSQQFNIQISGEARLMLGIALKWMDTTIANYPESLEFVVNEETILREVWTGYLDPSSIDEEYYFFPRPLNGSDVVTLKISNSNAPIQGYFTVYYI